MAPDPKVVPSLYQWMGGMPALRRLVEAFYDHVQQDPVLAPIFAHMGGDHVDHVVRFLAEVFGGPTTYSAELGGHPAMVRHHLGKRISEEQRQRWMQLLLRTADECGVPDDPEFRSAFVSYLEWGTRLAVVNSKPGVEVPEGTPMPIWGWGEVKGPYLK
jgi:hemoglobin